MDKKLDDGVSLWRGHPAQAAKGEIGGWVRVEGLSRRLKFKEGE